MMIIECVNCDKKFQVNAELIPDAGRTIQCGSCNHLWFFKISDLENQRIAKVNIEQTNEKKTNKSVRKQSEYLDTRKNLDLNKKNYELTKYKEKSNFSFGKLLSYIIVFLISFIAIIILIDTFKVPLYEFFPNLEIISFSFFETLKDIKLFIIDLF